MDWQLSQDLDLFGGMLDKNESNEAETSDKWWDVLNWLLPDSTEQQEDQSAADSSATADERLDNFSDPTDWASEESTEETTTDEGWEEVDVDQIVDSLLETSSDIDEKVSDIKDEAETTGNEDLVRLIDELQWLLVEKNQTIDELTRKNDFVSNKLADKYWDAENYAFYKWTIEKLENNQPLNMLVKFYDSDNEKTKEKVVWILSDMIYEKTGQDISDLINAKQKDSVANALTDVSWGWEIGTPEIKDDKDKTYNRDESINNLF